MYKNRIQYINFSPALFAEVRFVHFVDPYAVFLLKNEEITRSHSGKIIIEMRMQFIRQAGMPLLAPMVYTLSVFTTFPLYTYTMQYVRK